MVLPAYSKRTYESRNPIRRFAHNARFQSAARFAKGRVLDYGCGDGRFLKILRDRGISAVGYEPYMQYGFPEGVTVYRTLEDLGQFDCITCLEVMEHLTDEQQDVTLANVCRLLKPGGVAVFSVPVMIGPSGFFKLLHEFDGSKNRQVYTVGNALRCLVMSPPKQRWFSSGGTMYHMGFDYRVLRWRLRSTFRVTEEQTSPLRGLPAWLNSQVFFLCRL